MISAKLLNALHQSRYVYFNENMRELYIWHGTNVIKIYNQLGEDLGQFNIVNYPENREYKKHESINIRDVTLSIDDIVTTSYRNER